MEINQLSMGKLLSKFEEIRAQVSDLNSLKKKIMQRVIYKRDVQDVEAKTGGHELIEKKKFYHKVESASLFEFVDELRYTDAASCIRKIDVTLDESAYAKLDRDTQKKLAALITRTESTSRRVKALELIDE
tara:strand:+ start:3097 stop:3489 length:393 start_codon:yes stop_codon:yes gene_type:complete